MGSAAKALFVVFSIISPAIIQVSISPSSQSKLGDEDAIFTSSRNINLIDVPEWRIGDNWMYDGYLDVADFVASSGVSSNVETLDGTLDMTVVGIYEDFIEGNSSLV